MADRIGQQQPGFFQSLFDGAFKGDFSKNESTTKTAAQIGIGFVPIAGQIADVRDTAAAAREIVRGSSGGWVNMGLALAGWIPLAGDFIKSSSKIGVRGTWDGVAEAFSSVRKSWREITDYGDARMGEFKGLFYRPATDLSVSDLPDGTYGATNRWGDIEINSELDDSIAKATLDHEKVHSALSAKFKFGQELRANISLLGYAESHLLRRVEEGLAEGWARFKAQGISGVFEGWRFPYENPYGLSPERVKVERDILLGIGASALASGAAIADQVNDDQ